MVLTMFPSTHGLPERLTVEITADTVCSPHGHVSRGDLVEVDRDEYFALKSANKCILAPPASAPIDGSAVDEIAQQAEDPAAEIAGPPPSGKKARK